MIRSFIQNPKFLRFFALLTFVIAISWVVISNQINNRRQVLSIHTEEEKSAFGKLAEPFLGIPKKIIIKKAEVETEITIVGVDENGVMETPKDWKITGWFVESNKLGGNGNVIINGHYDDNYGRPAVFWKLKNLAVGDTFDLIDEFGRQFKYTVFEVYYVAIDSPDRFDVFKFDKDKKTATLITCGGVWVPGKSIYNKRLIVRAGLE